MYEIAICDDDAAFASGFQALLGDMLRARGAAFRFSCFSAPAALLSALESGARFDLVFLDILFGREEGIRFARRLRAQRWSFDLVFVTSCPDYAVDGYDAYPLSYLLKPVSREKLANVTDRFLEKHAPRALRLTTSKGIIRLTTADILYFEIFDHNILVHKADGSSEWLTGTLKELENALPPRCFVRPHRSYLVNLEHVCEIMRYQIKLSSGAVVPVSKNLYKHVQLSLIDYDDHRVSSR